MKTTLNLIIFVVLFSTFLSAQSLDGYSFQINTEQLAQQLAQAPDVFAKSKYAGAPLVELPLPDGRLKAFRLFRTEPMHPGLAAKYPGIQTFHGRCEDDGISAVALTLSPAGLQAMVMDDAFQRSFIEPAAKPGGDFKFNTGNYVSYYDTSPDIQCQHSSTPSGPSSPHPASLTPHSSSQEKLLTNNPLALGDKLRTHRLAISATGEFTQANGGTPATVMPVVVSMVNSINLFYIREFAINFQLVPNTDLLFFTDPNTDPYTSTGHWDPDLAINVATTDNIIGSANYDIGHLMQLPLGCPGCGGWAGAGPCNSYKAGGMSVYNFNVIAHEMAHQFSAPHTTDPPFPERYEHTAIGNTIMGGNFPGNSFHVYSTGKVANWVETPGYCVPGANTNNTIPLVSVGTGGMSIPKSTPFQLSGSATDPDPNTTLLYTWQQYDNEINYSVVNQRIIPAGNSPVFRNFNPSTTSNVRTIPRLVDLVNNSFPFGQTNGDTLNWETLPDYSRSITFRLVAKDYELTGGAYDYGELTFLVDGNSGPFKVTSPNTGNPTWTAGNNVTVTWDVANTNNAPVSCANVNIKLSTDGGFTYPYTLAANTPNDGTQTFTLPNGIPSTVTARVRVECATYTNVVFFDISNQNFTISSPCVANAGVIAPVVDVTAPQGSSSLDLTLSPVYGLANGNALFTVPSGPNNSYALFNNSGNCIPGCCQSGYSTMDFQVDKAGVYTFVIDYNGAGPDGFASIHTGSYNPASPCDNFITANWNETGGGIGPVSPIQGTFTPGVTYTMFFTHWYGNNNSSGVVTFSNPDGGNVILIGQGPAAPPASDYGYTYVAVNTGTGLIAAVSADANFTTLPGGVYRVYGMSYKSANSPPAVVNPASLIGLSQAGALATFQCIHFSNNFVNVVVTGCTPPTINAPTVTQPTCFGSPGIITVNASGSGTLEYSVNNGANWQTSAVFSNLSPGNYNIRVRHQSNPICSLAYAGNPVVLSVPAAPVFASTDVPKAISPSGTPTVTSTLTIPASGVIADVNVVNLTIDHTFISDLRVKLKSPSGTERILLDRICGEQDNILIHFDDESANAHNTIPCPPNGGTYQPNQSLSPFDGENVAGIWTLTIEDVADQDGGALQGWGIQVCYNTCPVTLPVNGNPVVAGTYSAQQFITSTGKVANNASVLFKAGTSVELLPGFEIFPGGVFEVMMQGCMP